MNFSSTPRRQSWTILGGWVALLLVLATVRPLSVPDEGRYGEIGRWMLVSGDWLTPRLDGIPFFHKPPLLHWLQALAMSVFGVNAWAARLAPAAHAALMLVALYLGARRISGEATARRAVVMLGSSLAFLLGGQYVNHDMLVACWIGVAIWCFALAFMSGPRPDPVLARLGFVACALGVMSKMLIGLALPGLVLLIWLVWTRQWRKMLYLPWLSGLLLFGLVAVPWFVVEQLRYPGSFDYMFLVQQFGRYTGGGFNNVHPWWTYVPVVLLGLFPWSFFALYLGWRQWHGRSDTSVVSGGVEQAQGVLLCWIWVVAIVVFFSIPKSKIVGYVLPVMPPMALLAAWGWEQAWGQWPRADRWLAGVAVLAAGLAVAVTVFVGRTTDVRGGPDVARALACLADPSDKVYVGGDYPYELPFYAQTTRPLIVIQDWPTQRRTAADNWRRELFEGADFDPAAGQVLQTPDVLERAVKESGNWLIAPSEKAGAEAPSTAAGWVSVFRAPAATLYRSAPERPKTAQHKGLPGCHDLARQ